MERSAGRKGEGEVQVVPPPTGLGVVASPWLSMVHFLQRNGYNSGCQRELRKVVRPMKAMVPVPPGTV